MSFCVYLWFFRNMKRPYERPYAKNHPLAFSCWVSVSLSTKEIPKIGWKRKHCDQATVFARIKLLNLTECKEVSPSNCSTSKNNVRSIKTRTSIQPGLNLQSCLSKTLSKKRCVGASQPTAPRTSCKEELEQSERADKTSALTPPLSHNTGSVLLFKQTDCNKNTWAPCPAGKENHLWSSHHTASWIGCHRPQNHTLLDEKFGKIAVNEKTHQRSANATVHASGILKAEVTQEPPIRCSEVPMLLFYTGWSIKMFGTQGLSSRSHTTRGRPNAVDSPNNVYEMPISWKVPHGLRSC